VNAAAPRDPGLQPERTMLAWRRTALALVVIAAVATRYLAVELGPYAAMLGGAGILLATIALASAHHRFRKVVRGFHAADAREAPLPTAGRTLALTALAALAIGVGGLVLVLGRL
jgi:uncharacterized membrane protein YidH (DUF202 family)